jgi:hypothetical protein
MLSALTSCRGVLPATAVALFVCMLTEPSHANGRFPAAQFVMVGPGAASDVIVLRTTFGLVVSKDAGRTWQWLCEDLFDYGQVTIWDPRLALGSHGADGVPLLVGIPTGLMRTLDQCTATRVPEMGMEFTGDVTTSADGQRVFWVASNGTGRNRIAASNDGGRTFTFRGAGPEGLLFETIEVAGADARRVYLTGVTSIGERRVLFYRSDDGGDTLEELPIDLRGGVSAFLAAVDPTNADVAYVRAELPDRDGVPTGTVLLRTSDGGRHFDELTRTTGPMMGFALSGDGRTIWVGGPDENDRLKRSDDGGRSFRTVSTVPVQCLRWHAGVLYVCSNNYAQGYALGRSTDGGETVTAFARFSDIQGPPACATDAAQQLICRQRWNIVRPQINPDASVAPMRNDAGGDAALSPPVTPPSDCACHATPTRSRAGWALVVAFAAALRGRRRTRQRSV